MTEAAPPAPLVRLRLFVTGHTPASRDAVTNLRRLCEAGVLGAVDLTIVDVLEQPQAAEDERILATPTLIKDAPQPGRRIIGDLSDRAKVLKALSLSAVTPDNQGEEAQ